MSKDLLQQMRKEASDQSLGLSHAAIYESILNLIRHLGARGSALDFGAGQGVLTNRLGATGQFDEVTGVDLMERPPSLDPSFFWRQQDLNESLGDSVSEWNEKFDLIVAAEVIEHLENPRAVVRACRSWLKPGGILIMSTPNNESWRALLSLVFRGHFVDFLDNSYPAHISALLACDMQRIYSECALSGVRIEYTNHGGIPRWPALTWQKLSKHMFKGKRFSDNMIVIGRKQQISMQP